MACKQGVILQLLLIDHISVFMVLGSLSGLIIKSWKCPLLQFYLAGVNFPGSLILLIEKFWIFNSAKIQIFMYTIILATKIF